MRIKSEYEAWYLWLQRRRESDLLPLTSVEIREKDVMFSFTAGKGSLRSIYGARSGAELRDAIPLSGKVWTDLDMIQDKLDERDMLLGFAVLEQEDRDEA